LRAGRTRIFLRINPCAVKIENAGLLPDTRLCMTDDERNQDEQPAPRLGRLHPRDTSEAKSSSVAYSRLVGRLRWILPLLAILGLVTLTLWPFLKTQTLTSFVVERVPNLMVEHLHLTGMDERNQSYSLTAARALQASGTDNQNLIDLEKPEAEISLQSGAWVAGHAAYGRIDQTDKKVWLGGAVEFFHDAGYRFTSDEVFVDFDKKAAWGEKPVLIQGGFGEIRGQGFRLLDGGAVFVVVGPGTAKLDLQAMKRPVKPSGKDSPSR